MKTNKDLYRKFCKENTDIPIFLQPFWLDIASADWDVIICSENTIDHEKYSKIIAALPYCIKGNFVTKRIFLPEINSAALWHIIAASWKPHKINFNLPS